MRREQPNGLNGKRKREKNYGKEYRFHWRETLYQFCTFFKNLKNLGLRWVFTAAHGWLSVVVSGATFHPGARASRCCGFSCAPGGAQVLRERALVVVVQGLSCPVACGIFLDQRSNLCPLHLQVNSQPLYHQGSPVLYFFFFFWEKSSRCPGAIDNFSVNQAARHSAPTYEWPVFTAPRQKCWRQQESVLQASASTSVAPSRRARCGKTGSEGTLDSVSPCHSPKSAVWPWDLAARVSEC